MRTKTRTRAKGMLTCLAGSIGLLLLMSLIAGCLNRQPAPQDSPKAEKPFQSIADWRGIQLPKRPAATDGEPLPRIAGRLSVGPKPDQIYADTALLDGSSSARFAEDWTSALALVEEEKSLWVLILDEGLLHTNKSKRICERLAPAAPKMRLATQDGLGLSLATVCKPPLDPDNEANEELPAGSSDPNFP